MFGGGIDKCSIFFWEQISSNSINPTSSCVNPRSNVGEATQRLRIDWPQYEMPFYQNSGNKEINFIKGICSRHTNTNQGQQHKLKTNVY